MKITEGVGNRAAVCWGERDHRHIDPASASLDCVFVHTGFLGRQSVDGLLELSVRARRQSERIVKRGTFGIISTVHCSEREIVPRIVGGAAAEDKTSPTARKALMACESVNLRRGELIGSCRNEIGS